MKKFISILLCFALTASCGMFFSACEQSAFGGAETASIVGDWECVVDFGGMMKEMLFAQGDAVSEGLKQTLDLSDIKLVMCVSFEEDGEYAVSFKKESVEEMVDELLEILSSALNEYLTEMFQIQGVTLETFLQQQNATWEELMERTFPRKEIIEELDVSEDGKYAIVGNKLYFDGEKDEYTEFTLTSDELSFTKVVSDDLNEENLLGILDALLPLKFARKA